MIDFDPQYFPIEIIDNVQGAKGSSALLTVTHKIQCTAETGSFWLHQRITLSGGHLRFRYCVKELIYSLLLS
jgi:hypothetical protein